LHRDFEIQEDVTFEAHAWLKENTSAHRESVSGNIQAIFDRTGKKYRSL
jgi:hypothetical protein